MGFIDGTCSICKKDKKVRMRMFNNRYTCQKCYLEIMAPKEICCKCNSLKNVQTRDENGNPICRTCYVQPKQICFMCGKNKIVQGKDNNGNPLCISCYGRPILVCNVCGQLRRVSTRDKDNNPVCNKCNLSKDICSICNRNTFVAVRKKDGTVLCPNCSTKIKYHNNPQFHIRVLLRNRVRKAFKIYSITKKIRKSKEYGIDYEEIIKYLGPCPGKIEDYHIDHIFPLVAFDFNNLEHITAAFAPENHQWLRKEENLKKNDKYNKQEFVLYIKKYLKE